MRNTVLLSLIAAGAMLRTYVRSFGASGPASGAVVQTNSTATARTGCGARTRTLNSRARTWRVADYSTPQR